MASVDRQSRRLVSGPELARTYAHPAYADPWEAAVDYQTVRDYAAGNPDAGSSAIASHFDLPRGRVRPWLDGSRPDCVHGLETAERLGWVDVAPAGRTFRGLNVLVAWTFSGGSILRDTWVPYFVSDGEADRDLLERAGTLVGVRLDYTRSAGSSRARELRPVENASVLGRVLTVLGAPRGEKNEAGRVSLPEYLEDAPERVRQEFVQVYLRNRGRRRPETDEIRLQVARPERYRRSLATLVRGLTGQSVSVSRTSVVLSAAAGREIRAWPPVLDVGGT